MFWGQTTSLCETCLALVPAKIKISDNEVWYEKRCQQHGVQSTLVSTDAAYWRLCKDYIKPGDRPLALPEPHRVRLPLRLRPVPGPRAAFLPGADRDQRALQPDLPGVLRRFFAGARQAPAARDHRAHARRAGGERRRARPRADLRRRADAASAVLRRARRRARAADPARDDQHQRPAHRARARFRGAPRRAESAGSKSICSSIRSSATR